MLNEFFNHVHACPQCREHPEALCTEGRKILISIGAEFHTHLDSCQQCRENPFALCPEGLRLLKEVAARHFSEMVLKPTPEENQKVEHYYCVGCGKIVCRSDPGPLSVSCRCGAQSPILVDQAGSLQRVPQSLGMRLLSRTLPPACLGAVEEKKPQHLEYYLGYSRHKSKAKTAWYELIRKLGLVSQQECRDKKCQEAYYQRRVCLS